jgi:hypothetical protein
MFSCREGIIVNFFTIAVVKLIFKGFFLENKFFYILFSLYLLFLSFHLFIIFFSYFYFFIIFFSSFFFIVFFGKRNYFFLYFEYLSLYTWHVYTIFFLHLFFCKFFYSHFKKKYYTNTKKTVFYYSNWRIVLFFCYIKNSFEILNVFINMYNFYYILLYISINILIYSYIFY